METRKRALGMGLEQLFNNENLDLTSIEKQIYDNASSEEIIEISLDELRPNPYQPRKTFADDKLNELAESIKEHGVFQPIIVKKSIKGYEIIAGERRFRASKLAGKAKIPAIVRNFTDEQMMEIALLENLQRENLSSIEEAVAYKSMIDKLNMTQEDLAKKVGKSRSHITNILGLLRLPDAIQQMIIKQEISMSHARVLSKLESETEMMEMANKILKENLPVHELEIMAIKKAKKVKNERKRNETSTEYKYVEELMSEKLDARVRIKDNKIEINFNNVNDLNRILEILEIKE
ncbi:MAG TPA: ParB/RepB/Spo0J family partition protein [Bacilli bacterium]|nr:ParB/RepB/Spo0J family partition protein [Bacilli bacterium]